MAPRAAGRAPADTARRPAGGPRPSGSGSCASNHPGIGESTNHLYGEIREWAADVAVVADHFGSERFLVVGLSGAVWYALACGHELPDRVVAIGVLGGLVPTAGDDAAAAGVVALANRFNRILTMVRVPFGTAVQGFLKVSNPLANQFYGAFARVMPEGDRKVFADPTIREMFIEDLSVGGAKQFHAMPNDIVLVGREWGFRLEDVSTPVRWWHGDADPFVGLTRPSAPRPACRTATSSCARARATSAGSRLPTRCSPPSSPTGADQAASVVMSRPYSSAMLPHRMPGAAGR